MMKNILTMVLSILLIACSETSAERLERRVISDNLVEFTKNRPDEDVDDYVPKNNKLSFTINNDTLVTKFKLINSGGYHFNGNINWHDDTLTLVLFDNSSEPMLEEFVEEYLFKVKLNQRKPNVVRYRVEY
jgi:hypothetical protein